MRARDSAGLLTVHAIAGTTLSCWAWTFRRRPGICLASRPSDGTGRERALLAVRPEGVRETSAGIPPGGSVCLLEPPVQSFLWGRLHRQARARLRVPGRRAVWDAEESAPRCRDVVVTVCTESVDEGTHAIHFHRRVAGSRPGTGGLFEPIPRLSALPSGPTRVRLGNCSHPRGEHSTVAPGAHSARPKAPNSATTSANPHRPNVAPTPPPATPADGSKSASI